MALQLSEPDEYAELGPADHYWRDLQPWLQECGYMLRPRFRPGWVPSWQVTGEIPTLKEDHWSPWRFQVIDAVRISDDAPLMLKSIKDEEHPHEIAISTFLCSGTLGKDPKNHCLPLLEVLNPPSIPGTQILVMKLLRGYEDPHFDTIGEAVEFFRQIFDGSQFMHKNLVAHRDCSALNIMMDVQHLYPRRFHPQFQSKPLDYEGTLKHFTRTQAPVKYYLIDFGISLRFDPAQTDSRVALPIIGADKTVPEFEEGGNRYPVDPFATDIYYLGNLIRSQFLDIHPGREGFEFMRPLVADMVKRDPKERPTIDEVVGRFETIVSGLSAWKLRSRARGKEEYTILSLPRIARHWYRRIGFMLRRVPAVPSPSSQN
ncbi:hypothetical protein DFH09DRAFT_1493362 [Mycena vulgaris]|nr:hypothetical protein DFH09DRAFT_1493362 [Mycena vulgaris]